MTNEEARKLATQMAIDLFTDVTGRSARRLMMDYDGNGGGTGWSIEAVEDRLTKATLAAESRKGLRQRWIPVSERLPEQGVRVLLSRGAVIIVGHYCGLSKNWSDGGSYALRAPTHWMPLPEPPQALTDGGTGG